MPNHILNKLHINAKSPEQLTAIRKFLKGKDTDDNSELLIDFNNIIPMPEELRHTQAPNNAPLKEIKRLEKKYGFSDWYYWSIANWGTKWNSYENRELADNEIEFQTAWSTPKEVIKALSYKFPDAKFRIEYADEDCGYNVGRYEYKNGEATYNEDYSGTKAGGLLYIELWEDDMVRWNDETNELEYIDEDMN